VAHGEDRRQEGDRPLAWLRFRGQYEQELKQDLDVGGVEITAGIPGENAAHKTI
jgi:hypothetical protein